MWRLVLAHVRDDLRARYTGSFMGLAWNVLNPLAQIAIYSVVFTAIFTTRGQGFAKPGQYVVYLCVGLFPWLAFAEGLARSSTSLIEGAQLLRRAPLPLALFPGRVVLAAFVNATLALGLLLAVAPWLGVNPSVTWLLAPLPLLALMALALGGGMALAALGVLIRDVAPLVHLILPLMLWSVPIIYVEGLLPTEVRSLLPAHPVYPAVRALHELVLGGVVPGPRLWALLLGNAGLALALGWLAIRALDSEVRDAT